MVKINMRNPVLEQTFRSIGVRFQATAATINRSMNRAMAPMKGIGVSLTAIFRKSGISPASISQDSSAPRNSR